jgi:hypothetical protein
LAFNPLDVISKNEEKLQRCSQFCLGQSTSDPQGPTDIGLDQRQRSIESTCGHAVSIGFNKRLDLLWEQPDFVPGRRSPSSTLAITFGLWSFVHLAHVYQFLTSRAFPCEPQGARKESHPEAYRSSRQRRRADPARLQLDQL